MDIIGWIVNVIILTMVVINAARPDMRKWEDVAAFVVILAMCMCAAWFLTSVRPW